MSLLAWFPLTKNGNNQGITTNNFILEDSLFDTSGKIGKYLKIDNVRKSVVIDGLSNAKQVSIAFWFKEMEETVTNWQDFIMLYGHYDDGTKVADGEVRIENYNNGSTGAPSVNWYSSVFNKNYPDSTSALSLGNHFSTGLNVWHHAVLEVDFELHNWKCWFDGQYISETQINSNAKYFNDRLYIGDGSITCGLNDIRVYDHLLSKAEIKEIVQGLVLHYPLNSGYGNENLLVEGNKLSSWTQENCTATQESDENFSSFIKITSTTTNRRIFRGVNNVWTTVGEIFTVSFYAKTETDGMTIDLSRSISDFTDKFSLTGEWKRYVGHIKVTSSSNTGTLSVRLNIAGTVCIADIKLERGEIDTFYVPNEADALYSKLGYDSTTIYDTSGFGNNGVFNNTKTYSIDTPLYDNSINLQKANSNYINLQNTYITNQSTINFWGKVNTFNNWQRFFEFCNVLQGQAGNHRILLATSGNTQQLTLHIYGGDTGTTSLYINNNITTIDTNWHMYSIVFNKTNLKVFMDGTSIVDTTMTQELTSMVRQYSYIGKSSYSGDSYFDGNISDFRIYSTALSADDIKQLYESKARIDKNGNVYCNQFIDNDYEEELLTSQKMRLSQQNAQAAISYETNGSQIINIITFEDTLSGWRYLWNSSFDKTIILNNKLRLSFKYKLDSDEQIQGNVAMMKGNGTGSQTISKNTIYFNKQWQEYNGVITFGDTYDSQEIYIAINRTDFVGRTIYIKDLSLKTFNERDNINITKQSQIISSEITELESGKTNINKNNKLIVNEIIEI